MPSAQLLFFNQQLWNLAALIIFTYSSSRDEVDEISFMLISRCHFYRRSMTLKLFIWAPVDWIRNGKIYKANEGVSTAGYFQRLLFLWNQYQLDHSTNALIWPRIDWRFSTLWHISRVCFDSWKLELIPWNRATASLFLFIPRNRYGGDAHARSHLYLRYARSSGQILTIHFFYFFLFFFTIQYILLVHP